MDRESSAIHSFIPQMAAKLELNQVAARSLRLLPDPPCGGLGHPHDFPKLIVRELGGKWSSLIQTSTRVGCKWLDLKCPQVHKHSWTDVLALDAVQDADLFIWT